MRKWGGLAEPTLCSIGRSVSDEREVGRREEACHRPVVTLGMRRVPRLPSGMMHCHVRPKAGSTQYSREEKSKDREGRGGGEQSWVEAGCPRSHWRPPSRKPQVTRKSSGSFSARNSFKNVLATFAFPFALLPSPGRFPSLRPTQDTLCLPLPPLLFSSLSLRNVPQPAKHNELLHLRSRCSIKSVLPYSPLPSPFPPPLHSLFAQFQFHCPFPSRSAHHFPFSALLFFISSKVSRLMFWVAASQWQFLLLPPPLLPSADFSYFCPAASDFTPPLENMPTACAPIESVQCTAAAGKLLHSVGQLCSHFKWFQMEINLFKYPLNKALMKRAWQTFSKR